VSSVLLAVAGTLQGRLTSAAQEIRVPGRLATLGAWLRTHVPDEWWVAALATILSIGAYAWCDLHALTAAFPDAESRQLIARRVVSSRTPGLAQLGTTWLPLPSLLMLPLIWNDALFRDGIAASLPSMLGYVLASVYLYRIGRLVTGSRLAGWIAAAVLMFNPSILYMQSTAMSEMLSITSFVIATYYALRLVRTAGAQDIVKCAAAVAAGTLIRYENWAIAVALLPIVAYAAWRHRGYVLAEAWTILFGLLAFAGCAAWMIYNAVIFHDPVLAFFYGHTAHNYYPGAQAANLPVRHHAWFALQTYGYSVLEIVGWAVAVLAVAGLLVFLWRARLRVKFLPAYVLLVPLGFYWLVLFLGFNTETMPELGTGLYYQVRFGLLMVPAVGLFAAFAVSLGRPLFRKALATVALGAILASAVLSVGQTPFVVREALNGGNLGGQAAAKWLAGHYQGGSILTTYINSAPALYYLLTENGFSDATFITDSNGEEYSQAVEHPQTSVNWIVMNAEASEGENQLWVRLQQRTELQQYFVLRQTFGDGVGRIEIYERLASG
jgi:hypothetical protein